MLSRRLGSAEELVVRVVVVLVVAFLAAGVLEAVAAAARFSLYRSEAAFVRAASLSLWATR